MTGKDLVRRPDNQVAELETTQSPCPIFDRQVKTLVLEIDGLVRNRNVFPADRETERNHYAYALRKLVDAVEAGNWSEPMPVPESGHAPVLPTRVIGPNEVKRSILDLTEDDFLDQWNEMTREEKMDWMRSG